MNDKELETKIYDYFDNEVPEPNQKILEELKTKMHQRKTSSTKRFNTKIRLALLSCMVILLIIPAVTLPFVWNNSNSSTPPSPSTPPVEEEIDIVIQRFMNIPVIDVFIHDKHAQPVTDLKRRLGARIMRAS